MIQYDRMIHYLTIDFFIDILFQDDRYKHLIEAIPLSNPNMHSLRMLINHSFDSNHWQFMQKDTMLYKLTYKNKLEENRPNGELTYYGWIKKNLYGM